MIYVSIILAGIYLLLSVLASVLCNLHILTYLLFKITLRCVIFLPFTGENGKQTQGS